MGPNEWEWEPLNRVRVWVQFTRADGFLWALLVWRLASHGRIHCSVRFTR